MVSYMASAGDVERELGSGERLLWSGQPKAGIHFRPSDAFMIPFSLLWGGFALFWETTVIFSGAPFFFMLWGLPFVLVGAYITVGRFFVDAYTRSRTSYGLTNERILIISGFINRNVQTLPLRTLQEIALNQRADGSGTITFGTGLPYAAGNRGFTFPGGERQLKPAFDLIPNVKDVYDRIRQAQQAT